MLVKRLTWEDVADVPTNQTIDDTVNHQESQHPIKSEFSVDDLITQIVPLNTDTTNLKQSHHLTGVTKRRTARETLQQI